ncbi:MAG: multicopper oxidase domain-containing protein [Candidatus Eisenbacteria bacterium]
MTRRRRLTLDVSPAPVAASLALLAGLALGGPAQAGLVEYALTVTSETVHITGRPSQAMTINGAIPGPTMRFTEGDTARISVSNEMSDPTSIHWHGVLVPPGMDGVPYVSFPPIESGATFVYEFPVRQSGTYWYHSHSGLQEQSGLYGSIVIDPAVPTHDVDRELVIVLSDWTDEDPHSVNRTLRRGSEWYSLKRGDMQSLLGSIREGMLGSYLRRELLRMPPMDIADVAYDRFLANGVPQSDFQAHHGETIRLRIINGSATTYFHVEFAGGPMTVISADGIDVVPFEETRLLIAVAETYDVLVRIPGHGAHELRATAQDGSGRASVWLGSAMHRAAPDVPRPNLYHMMGGMSLGRMLSLMPAGTMGMSDADVSSGMFDRPGMMDMRGMDMGGMDVGGTDTGGMEVSEMRDMDMAGMHRMETSVEETPGETPDVQAEEMPGMSRPPKATHDGAERAVDGMDPRRPWPPYEKLRALEPTAFAGHRPVREVRLTLDGDMDRYVWLLNGKTLSESDAVLIEEGEVVRFIMVNRTMMHHPMHLHGHFFRVLSGQGEFAPLKHTVNVAPMSTTVIEFDANEFGDWFFHCHLLYHMKAGMARVVHYEGFGADARSDAVPPELRRDPWYVWGQADVLSNMTEGSVTLANTRSIVTATWETGWGDVESARSDATLTYDRYVNRFFSVFAGADALAEDADVREVRGVAGLRYLLPLNLESSVWADTDGGARANLAKELQLTPRFALRGEAQYDTHSLWEGNVDVSYTAARAFSLVGRWHSDFGYGGGLTLLF